MIPDTEIERLATAAQKHGAFHGDGAASTEQGTIIAHILRELIAARAEIGAIRLAEKLLMDGHSDPVDMQYAAAMEAIPKARAAYDRVLEAQP